MTTITCLDKEQGEWFAAMAQQYAPEVTFRLENVEPDASICCSVECYAASIPVFTRFLAPTVY